jgi:hypothetical protein
MTYNSPGGEARASASWPFSQSIPGDRTDDTHERLRNDRIDQSGKITMRHGDTLYSIGIGRTHTGTRVLVMVQDLDIRIIAWTVTGVAATAVIIGLTVATWGLFRRSGWWEQWATVSSLIGIVALVPYWVAATRSGVANPAFDVTIHALGSVGVLVLLHAPRLEHWVPGLLAPAGDPVRASSWPRLVCAHGGCFPLEGPSSTAAPERALVPRSARAPARFSFRSRP